MSESPRILIIGDVPRTSTPAVFGFFSEWQWEFYRTKLVRAGIRESDISFCKLADFDCKLKPNLIVTLGDRPLTQITGKKSVEKYHGTPAKTKTPARGGRRRPFALTPSESCANHKGV